eukprot:2890399-Rhodomonas_salina.1
MDVQPSNYYRTNSGCLDDLGRGLNDFYHSQHPLASSSLATWTKQTQEHPSLLSHTRNGNAP